MLQLVTVIEHFNKCIEFVICRTYQWRLRKI